MGILAKINGLYELKESIGISIFLRPDGQCSFHLSYLKKTNDEIEILLNESFQSWDTLLEFLQHYRAIPMVIQLQGRGVLIKEIPKKEEITDKFLVDVFPNFTNEVYLFTTFKGFSNDWLSLIRKELYVDILEKFNSRGYPVLQVFLGPFVSENILELMNGYSGIYKFAGHEISVDTTSGLWESYKFDPQEGCRFLLKIQGTEMKENYIIPYALAFSLLLQSYLEDYAVEDRNLVGELYEYRQKLKLKVNFIAFLSILLGLLLINALLFSHYSSKVEWMDSKSKEITLSQGKLDRLNGRSMQNDSLLREMGWNSGIRKSWLINQLMSSLKGRDGLQIQRVDVNPALERKLATKQNEITNPYLIKISGSSLSLNQLEDWVRVLRNLTWIEQVEINRFVSRSDPTSNLMDFMLNIEYRNER
ncbi:hypothetical protein [Sphingobacterium cellulitidis]|uniref:Fimbrial assembly protein (PilN) n=1 Tax=Sphingobacterium cellulitidis TaxID=1768011 RepID=A0A8H9KVH0_9SPHI|nr:hypothetical protein [Sphingobacterium soli]MBA8986153.1 hypothetical protein [Sphingobacterium soli]GGE18029.1 hypothetical protein GCM10011516_14590 [Sphingobacterium soli]